jgi:hypothetical protein
MSDIPRKERQHEDALRQSGPLQTAANVIWQAKDTARSDGFVSLDELLHGHKDVVIPEEMRDRHFWTFRMVALPKGDRIGDFYDYRFSPIYCHACDAQYRFAVSILVRYRMPNRWLALWTCPFGHTSEMERSDEYIQEHLCEGSRFRLIERHG